MIKLIWSQDELLGSEAVDEAVAAAKGAEHVTIDADAGLGDLEEAIFAGSLFATERLVVIRNAQVLKKADVERLSTALHADEVPTDVIVVAVAERMPTALTDALKDVAELERLTRPRRGELVNWVNKRLQRSGVKSARDAGPALVEALGENLRDIAQAIEQLALRAGTHDDKPITSKDVFEHFRPQSEQPIWVLFDAIVKHDGVKAFETLRRQLAAGDEPLPMLGAIVSQIRGIIRTKSIVEREPGISDRDISKELGVTEGRAAVMRRQCSRLSWDWLLAVHKLLAAADFELKGGEDGAVLPGDVIMERVVAGAMEAG
jgi:DNA polymerase III subunit delta